MWARVGVVYSVATDRIYLVTGNATYSPAKHHWGDTVLALNPDASGNANGDPLDAYTPTNFDQLNTQDVDLGRAGNPAGHRYARRCSILVSRAARTRSCGC